MRLTFFPVFLFILGYSVCSANDSCHSAGTGDAFVVRRYTRIYLYYVTDSLSCSHLLACFSTRLLNACFIHIADLWLNKSAGIADTV